MTTPLDGLGRAELCTLGREYLLLGHLLDRGSFPALLRHHSMAEANEIAIEEWMTTSPVYTRRMQRLLGFAGTDVETILKGLQLEIGMPHQYMDCGFELQSSRRGEFWLRSCGALADVVPMGEEYVRGMCHDIEDPTFDATAGATNPHAQVRPVHRPPGVPLGGPDCHWVITIDEAHPPVVPHPRLDEMAGSVLATLGNDPAPGDEPGGWDDYAGPFEPDFELEHLSQRALRIVVREFALQGHLLARATMGAVDRRDGAEIALEVGRATFTGIAWIASERIAAALDLAGPDLVGPDLVGPDLVGPDLDSPELDRIAAVIERTPLLAPVDYVGLTASSSADGLVLELDPDAAGLREGDPFSLPGLLAAGADEIIAALVHGVNAAATVTALGATDRRRWLVSLPPGAPAVAEPPEVRVMRFSGGPSAVLIRRRPLRTGLPT